MTVVVQGPDGSTFQFPDGTPQDTIVSAMTKHYGPPKAAPVTIPGQGRLAQQPVGSSEDVAAKALEGIPIIGAAVPWAGAAVSALANPLTGAGEQGETLSERIAKNLEVEKARSAAMEQEYPKTSLAAGLAGGTAALGGLGATAAGARVLGLGGATLPAQMAQGALSGAAISGADAAVRGGDPMAAGLIGAGVGGVLPGATRLAGALIQPTVNAVRGAINPAEEAGRRVAGANVRDLAAGTSGLTDAEFAAAQQAGQPVMTMDRLGETGRALTRSAANTSPEGRAILDRSINDRFESQSGRITDWLNQTFHYPNAAAQQAAIDNLERTTNRAAYQQAYQAGAGGVWNPELERLTSAPAVVDAMRDATTRGGNRAVASGMGGFNPGVTFDNGLMNFRRGPTGAPVYPDLQFWDLTQRNHRDASQAAFRQGRNEEGGALAGLHRQLLTQLDTAVPQFGAARTGAARFFGAENALEAGQNFVTSKLQNSQARAALAQMTEPERRLFQDGFVDRFIRGANEVGDRRNLVDKIARSPAERERLDIALGPQRSAELQAAMHVENVMDAARRAVQGNSTTARQLAELGLAGGAYTLGTGGNILNPDPASILSAALVYGAARGRAAIDHRVARQVAEMLVSQDPQRLANGMRILARTGGMLDSLRNASGAIARAGVTQGTQSSIPRIPVTAQQQPPQLAQQ